MKKRVSRGNRKDSSDKLLHFKCRSTDDANLVEYPTDNGSEKIKRPVVTNEHLKWTSKWPEYKPIEYTSAKVLAQPVWADPVDYKSINKWNEMDGNINRQSYTKKYDLNEAQCPLNVVGRTGISGRGQLGKWGPNHAADPIVTRWKKDDKGKIVKIKNKKVIQFVAIQRKDNGEYALPGGMCDPGEPISLTLRREFGEEALNSLESKDDPEAKTKTDELLNKIFQKSKKIYEGYVDDPRNTDNSWMETKAYNFHITNQKLLDVIKLEAGDDAGKVMWQDVNNDLKLYASHKDFVKKTANALKAHW